MRLNIKFDRDGNYYFGLGLLVLASASIIWAFFFDGFDPEDFLVYFLIYAWGYTLLLKSDSEYRLQRLEETVTGLKARLDVLETDSLVADQGEDVVEEDQAENGEETAEEGTGAEEESEPVCEMEQE